MNVDASILTSIKKMLGIDSECTDFDTDIIMHINSVFLTLSQLGVGSEDFMITDDQDVWTDFLPEGELLNSVKPYVYLKVKLVFDTPANSSHTESIKNIIKEFEFRINLAAESGKEEV